MKRFLKKNVTQFWAWSGLFCSRDHLDFSTCFCISGTCLN